MQDPRLGSVYKVFLFFLDVQLASLTTIRKVQRRGDSFQTQEKKFKIFLCKDYFDSLIVKKWLPFMYR